MPVYTIRIDLKGLREQAVAKADELQEAIDALESMDIDSIEVPDAGDVNFPGMY